MRKRDGPARPPARVASGDEDRVLARLDVPPGLEVCTGQSVPGTLRAPFRFGWFEGAHTCTLG